MSITPMTSHHYTRTSGTGVADDDVVLGILHRNLIDSNSKAYLAGAREEWKFDSKVPTTLFLIIPIIIVATDF